MTLFWKACRYGVVGVLTAVLHYGMLYTGVELLQQDTTVASSVGFVVAVTFNYLMHYNWTFGEPAPHGKTLHRYVIMVSCGFLINALVMYAGVRWLAVSYLIIQALAQVAVVLWNFVMSNLWVFRH